MQDYSEDERRALKGKLECLECGGIDGKHDQFCTTGRRAAALGDALECARSAGGTQAPEQPQGPRHNGAKPGGNREQRRARDKATRSQKKARRKLDVGDYDSPLSIVPDEELRDADKHSRRPYGFVRMWRSEALLVFECTRPGNMTLLMVQRLDGRDGLTWDVLQWVKAEVGYSAREALELYPRDDMLVNVANMRHLWLLPEEPAGPEED